MRYHDITENHQPRKIEKGRVFISLLRKVAPNQRIIQKIAFLLFSFFHFLFIFFPLIPLFSSLFFLFFLFSFLFFLHQKLTSDNNVALYT